ncbi:MAG: endonuclease/exonuclease/phosphatase family protein [Actinomycetota bacterium]|nr:endonuclease/exonuclease/phosphatase family protein [Actinomycetota bacterium]HZY66630.1 endonuclease/exonuclease/phosphatase family protein [Rubrobacteraceae bacterium]
MAASDVRIMSFNIRGASHKRDGVNVWSERAGMNVETIRRYGPDLIGFQEAQNDNLEVYEQELPGYARLPGPVYGTGVVEEHAAIFFDLEKLEAIESGGFWLSETPEKYSGSWQTEVIRCATWACFRSLENGAAFLHFNTHLDHISETARVEGSRLMLRKAEEIQASRGDLPVVVTGDFNCRPGSSPYQVFVENGFVDTFLVADGEPEDAYTFHAFKGTHFKPGDTDKPTGRIDWILVRDGTPSMAINSHEILRDGDEAAGRYPSDHYPILAELTLDG